MRAPYSTVKRAVKATRWLDRDSLPPLVDDPDRLPLAPRQRPRHDDLDHYREPERAVQHLARPDAERRSIRRLGPVPRGRLDPHPQLVLSIGARRQHDLILRRHSLDAEQRMLDLRREDVHPAHDQHVIRASQDLHDPGHRPDDMLIVRGVNVFPSQIEHALLGVEGLTPHYQIVLTTRADRQDELRVRIEAAGGSGAEAADRAALEARARDVRGSTPGLAAVTGT